MGERSHHKKRGDDDHLTQLMRWRGYVHQAEARLERDAADAIRLGMSYGNYMAAIHDGRIKRT